jgi:uncharacterized protein involved in outer membrane biogenesis
MLKKKTIIIPALVVITLVVVAFTFLYLYGFNTFKPMIARAIKDATGRELNIGGDIRILPDWPPTLTAENITFQNAPWGTHPQLLSVKRLSMNLSLLSLLRGEYRFVRIHLVEPELNVEFNPSGVSNFQMDIASDLESSAIPIMAFTDIQVQKGQIRFHDHKSDLKYSLNVDHLQAEIPGLNKSIRIEFQGSFRDLACTLDGSIGPIMAWIEPGNPLPLDLTAGLGNTTAQLKGTIRDPIDLKGISLKLSASGRSTLELTNLIGAPEIPDFGTFSVGAELNDGTGPLALERLVLEIGTPDLTKLSLKGSVRDLLEMQGAHLDLLLTTKNVSDLKKIGLPELPVDGPLRISTTFSDPANKRYRLDDIRVTLGENKFRGGFDLNLARKVPVLEVMFESVKIPFGFFSFDARLTGPVDSITLEQFEMKLVGERLGKAFVNGTVENLNAREGVNFNFNIYGDDLADLQKITGKPLPVRGPFAVSGNLSMPHRHLLQIPDLKVILDRNSLNGFLTVDLEGPNPKLTGTVTSNRLNLERLLSQDILPANILESVADVGPTRLVFETSGTSEQLVLNKIEFNTKIGDLGELSSQGSIGNLQTFSGIDLSFKIRGNELANFDKVIGHSIPVKGSFFLSGELIKGMEEAYHIENIIANFGSNSMKGRSTVDFSGTNPVISAEIAARQFSLQALSLGQNQILDRLKSVEDLGPIDIKATIISAEEYIALQYLDLSAGNDALTRIRVKGSIGDLSSLRDLDLSFKASSRDITGLELITGQTLPVRGSYTISGLVSDHSPNNFMLSNLDLSLGQNHVNGWVNLNLAGKYSVVEAELSADHLSVEPLTLSAVDPLRGIPDIGPFNLSIKLSQSGETQEVNYLDLSMGNENTIAIMLHGSTKTITPLRGLSLDFSINSRDLSILNNAYHTQYVNKLPIHIAGRLEDSQPGSYTISSLQATYGDSDLSGSASLNLAGHQPDLKAKLSSRKLDLRPILETLPQKDPTYEKPVKSSQPEDRVFSRQPFSLEALNHLNAEIFFHSQELLMPNFTFSDAAISLGLHNGVLDINPLKFTIDGGSADGRLSVRTDMPTPSMKANIVIKQFDLGPKLQQLGKDSTLKGSLDAIVDIESKGNSVAALMAGLSGKVYVSISNGQVQSDHLARLEKYLGGNVLDLFNPFKQESPLTEINCLVNRMDIKNGNTDYTLVIDTPQTALLVAGSIDLKTETLDIGIKPTPKKGFGDQNFGTISFSLGRLSRPLGIGGTLANPTLVMNTRRTFNTTMKFAGALALGPVGIVLFFSDVSTGKKNICVEANKKMPIKP